MRKQEFLEGLQASLATAGSAQLIRENLRFYSDYIDAEIGKGRSEKEVMEELGDPRLIANSIKESLGIDDEFSGLAWEEVEQPKQAKYQEKDFTAFDDVFSKHAAREPAYEEKKRYESTEKGNSWQTAFYVILAVLVLLLILLFIFAAWLIKLLMPFVLPLLIIWIILRFFDKR